MANVAFKKGLLANLPSSYSEGTFYVTTDERALYLDVNGSSRIRLGDFQEFETLEALRSNVNPSTAALYYISSLNVLAKWTGTEYVQINLDTGATSIEVVGNGNAVTAAAYDEATRKLTLTMGETFATEEFVGAIPDGYTETNIVAYINKKAEETLNAASGGSSESAASVLAALNTYKTENDPKVSALQSKAHEHANKAELDLIASGDKAKWDAAEQNAKDYAKGLVDAEAERADIAEKANAAAAKAADDKAVAAQEDVDALELLVGDVTPGKTVVEMIADAKTAATYDDGEVWAELGALGDAVDLLNDGADVEGSVDYKIAQAVAAIMENPDETMNSINELVTWINGHATDALELSNKVTANEADIAALEALIGEEDVASQIEAAIAEALNVEGADKYALAADLTAAIVRIAAMEAKVSKWDAAEQNAKDYADGLNTAMDTRVKALEAIDHSHDNADVLAGITAVKVASWDAAEQNAKDYADGLNGAMNTRVEALEAIDHEHENADVLAGITAVKVAAWDAAQANAEAAAAAALATAKGELQGAIDAEAQRAAGAEAQVLVDAKAYADAQIAAAALAWGSF